MNFNNQGYNPYLNPMFMYPQQMNPSNTPKQPVINYYAHPDFIKQQQQYQQFLQSQYAYQLNQNNLNNSQAPVVQGLFPRFYPGYHMNASNSPATNSYAHPQVLQNNGNFKKDLIAPVSLQPSVTQSPHPREMYQNNFQKTDKNKEQRKSKDSVPDARQLFAINSKVIPPPNTIHAQDKANLQQRKKTEQTNEKKHVKGNLQQNKNIVKKKVKQIKQLSANINQNQNQGQLQPLKKSELVIKIKKIKKIRRTPQQEQDLFRQFRGKQQKLQVYRPNDIVPKIHIGAKHQAWISKTFYLNSPCKFNSILEFGKQKHSMKNSLKKRLIHRCNVTQQTKEDQQQKGQCLFLTKQKSISENISSIIKFKLKQYKQRSIDA